MIGDIPTHVLLGNLAAVESALATTGIASSDLSTQTVAAAMHDETS